MADFLRLAGTGAAGGEIASAFSELVVLECGDVGLEYSGEVVPECGREFGGWVSEGWGNEGAVDGFCGVVFCPDRASGLVSWVGEVGNVSCHVENAVGDGIDSVNAERWASRGWRH